MKRKKKQVYSSDDYNSNDGMLTTVWGLVYGIHYTQ